jgi:uncharacterized protein
MWAPIEGPADTTPMAASATPFWKRKTLEQLDAQEWESLCDGCGLCCLQKLQDEYTQRIYYTRVACRLLDQQSCRCTDYARRRERVPDCVQLSPAEAHEYRWLPESCAYRLLAEGQELPSWHHLVCGDPSAVHRAGISRAGQMLPEDAVPEDDWEDHIIFRVG